MAMTLAVSVVLFFTLTTVVAIFLMSRAPTMAQDDPQRYRVVGPRPTKLVRESANEKHRAERLRKIRRKVRTRSGTVIPKFDFTANDPPETIDDAASHLVSILADAERDLLRGAPDDMLSVEIRIAIRQNWQVCNPNSLLCFDAADYYQAFDADTVCDVIIETAQELLRLESGRDR